MSEELRTDEAQEDEGFIILEVLEPGSEARDPISSSVIESLAEDERLKRDGIIFP